MLTIQPIIDEAPMNATLRNGISVNYTMPNFVKTIRPNPVTLLPNGWGVAFVVVNPELALELLCLNATNQLCTKLHADGDAVCFGHDPRLYRAGGVLDGKQDTWCQELQNQSVLDRCSLLQERDQFFPLALGDVEKFALQFIERLFSYLPRETFSLSLLFVLLSPFPFHIRLAVNYFNKITRLNKVQRCIG